MSHVATIDIEIKDLDALGAACDRLGLELVRGQKTYAWYGRSMGASGVPPGFTAEELGKCEHAIRIKDRDAEGKVNGKLPYEIGIAPRKDGRAGYTLLWDSWQGGYGLVGKVGADAGLLRQEYAIQVATKAARRQGFRVTGRKVKQDGRVELQLQR